MRDFGMLVNTKSTFNDRIDRVTKQCSRITALIFRTFTIRDKDYMLILSKSMTLSKLNFAGVLWMANRVQNSRRIEHIQSYYATRIQLDLDNPNYWERTKTLRLYSVERCFERYHIIYVWKFLEEIVTNPRLSFYGLDSRLGVKDKIPQYTNHMRKNSVVVRRPDLFNLI